MKTNPFITLVRFFYACRKSLPVCMAIAMLGSTPLMAATYYVATTGSDSYSKAQAQNIATPWKTIQNAATNMAAGDTCMILTGTYRETVTVPAAASGSLATPTTFQAYSGTGTAIVNGADVMTGWTASGTTNVYYTPMSWTMGVNNQVFVSGTMSPEARWPNESRGMYPWQDSSYYPSADWSYMQTAGYSSGSNGWFTDSNLPSRAANYWVGGVVHVVSGPGWNMIHKAVTASTSTQITTNDSSVSFTGSSGSFHGNEYYISGIQGELDSPGEWFYNPSGNLLLYSVGTPTNVQAKHRTYGFVLTGCSNIQLVNLNFFACTIQSDTNTKNETLNGLVMTYPTHSNTDVWMSTALTLYDGSVLRNSVIRFSPQQLVTLTGSGIRVINNYLSDSGYMSAGPALGGGTGTWNALISHNTLTSTGYCAMGFPGHAAIVEFNDMSNAQRLLSDGGVLYSNLDAGNTVFRYNILHDSPGPVGHSGLPNNGFYLDDFNSNWVVHHNIISNVQGYSIEINSRCNSSMYFNNTCANVHSGGIFTSAPGMGAPDGVTTVKCYNNLFGVPASGNPTTLAWMDFRYNLYSDPGFSGTTFQLSGTSTQSIDKGTTIPGVSDVYLGAAPDLGAIESGSTDWTGSAGYKTTAPSPDPSYVFPSMTFSNLVTNGSFENGTMSTWTTSGSVSVINYSSWTDPRVRTGYYGLQFGQANSEISQTVTGLQPNRRYRVSVGTNTANATAAVTLGVRSSGNPNVSVSAPATTGTTWVLNSVTFFTGTGNTTAQIYLDVNSANATPVYVDDFSVVWDEPPVPATVTDPMLQYTLNQSSGSTAYDCTPNARNVTINGTVAWGSGVTLGGTTIYNNALTCNGVNTYVVTPSIPIPGEITMSCWAKSGSSGNWSSNWAAFFSDNSRSSFVFGPNGGTKTIYLTVYYPGGTLDGHGWPAPAGFDITQWHHYGAVISSAQRNATIYVDGSNVGAISLSNTMNVSTETIHIAHDSYSSTRCLYGTINDARIYNQALTPSQMQNMARMNGVADNSLQMWLPYDDGSGAGVAWDASGYGNSGTLQNITTGTSWVAGAVGSGALSFNGVNGCVLTSTMTTPTELTMCCWARSGVSGTWSNYAAFFCQSLRNSFLLSTVGGSTGITLTEYYTGTNYQAMSYTPPAGFDITQWHHYAATLSTANKVMYLYVDGLQVKGATMSNAINVVTAPIYIGHDTYTGASWYFNGQMDDSRIYNRVLSQNEILELSDEYNAPPYY